MIFQFGSASEVGQGSVGNAIAAFMAKFLTVFWITKMAINNRNIHVRSSMKS